MFSLPCNIIITFNYVISARCEKSPFVFYKNYIFIELHKRTHRTEFKLWGWTNLVSALIVNLIQASFCLRGCSANCFCVNLGPRSPLLTIRPLVSRDKSNNNQPGCEAARLRGGIVAVIDSESKSGLKLGWLESKWPSCYQTFQLFARKIRPRQLY